MTYLSDAQTRANVGRGSKLQRPLYIVEVTFSFAVGLLVSVQKCIQDFGIPSYILLPLGMAWRSLVGRSLNTRLTLLYREDILGK